MEKSKITLRGLLALLTLQCVLIFGGCARSDAPLISDDSEFLFRFDNPNTREELALAAPFWDRIRVEKTGPPIPSSSYQVESRNQAEARAFAKLQVTAEKLWQDRIAPFDKLPSFEEDWNSVSFGPRNRSMVPVLDNNGPIEEAMRRYVQTGRLPPEGERRLRRLGKEWMFDYKAADAEAAARR